MSLPHVPGELTVADLCQKALETWDHKNEADKALVSTLALQAKCFDEMQLAASNLRAALGETKILDQIIKWRGGVYRLRCCRSGRCDIDPVPYLDLN
jgi:hypothetical protein